MVRVSANSAVKDPLSGDSRRALKPRDVDHFAAARPLEFEPLTGRRNHNVFRYPAKFHPPVARRLVEIFSQPGDIILDPFCGSGTLLVEAATLNRHSVGTDVDPLAVFVANAKTSIADMAAIRRSGDAFTLWAERQRADDLAKHGEFDKEISKTKFVAQRARLSSFIPDLPRLDHWFRRRVTLQLASMLRYIGSRHEGQGGEFLRLCFASIVRNSSNADPVPVSGLEVTSHMLEKERLGRTVDPWRLMTKAIAKAVVATASFISDRTPNVTTTVLQADARLINTTTVGLVDAAITSPPYLTAVDYYRRHTLEMYWLGLTKRREQRLEVMTHYIGRDRVGVRHLPEKDLVVGTEVADRWLGRFRSIAPERERAFRHYCDGMSRALACMREVVKPRGPIVIVAGDVRFCGAPVSMLELMNDLAGDTLTMTDHLWYPIVNRYMSYSRLNEANIAADHVLVFRSRL